MNNFRIEPISVYIELIWILLYYCVFYFVGHLILLTTLWSCFTDKKTEAWRSCFFLKS